MGVCACRKGRTEADRPPLCEAELVFAYRRSHADVDVYVTDAAASRALLDVKISHATTAADHSKVAAARAADAARHTQRVLDKLHSDERRLAIGGRS